MYKINDTLGEVGKEVFNTKKIGIETNYKVNKLDSITKTSILLVLAGYKFENYINVYDKDISKLINIKEFADLNLNFKKAVSKNFDIRIKYSPLKRQLGKKILQDSDFDVILMLSGGIDSVAALLYCLDNKIKVLPMWIDFGQKNIAAEKTVINNLKKKLNIDILKVKINLKKYIDKGWDVWKFGIIPARNFMLLSFAELFISNTKKEKVDVYLCAARGEITEQHNDKSPKFYKDISNLFSSFTGRKIRVTTPFYNFNKSEILYYWEKKWKKKFGISVKDTMTCYTGNNCGECSSCYYRRINGIVAGVEDNKFLKEPLKDEGRIIRDYYLPNFNEWDNIRKVDFLIALSKYKSMLPKEILDFYNQKKTFFKKKIRDRKKQLNKIKISKQRIEKNLEFYKKQHE